MVSMRVGEVARFIIDPIFAYRDRGYERSVPPDAVIEYEVELLDVSRDPTEPEKLQIAQVCEYNGMGHRGRDARCVGHRSRGMRYCAGRTGDAQSVHMALGYGARAWGLGPGQKGASRGSRGLPPSLRQQLLNPLQPLPAAPNCPPTVW